jgi:carbamoyltransferase
MVEVPPPPDDRFDGPIPALRDRDDIRRQHLRNVARLRRVITPSASFNYRADLALGVQHQVETQIMKFLAEPSDPAPVLIMAGGVALNCTINTVVAQWCAVRGGLLTIPPPANDGGIAIGAAVAAAANPVDCVADGAYLGREFTPAEISGRLAALGVVTRPFTPDELAEGLVDRDLLCGWFEGRAEIGPRALGKRAILARPDSTRTRDRLNVLKGRENWRPLAPSLLPEDFDRAFQGTPSPYMLLGAEANPAVMGALAGVIHVDNTARPQVVDGNAGDRAFAAQLHAMKARTGYGAITCTSFNPAGSPIVYTPEDAYRAAVTIGLDLLAGDGWCAPIPRR